MPVLQQYYTSCINEVTRFIGFQVKAMSPGISMQTQETINRLVAYRIPSSLDERAINTHPVALRYWCDSTRPSESIFLCSQSIGSDVNGRGGNFFAHTVIMPPDIFASVPPILYWKSSFWQNKDTQIRTQIDSLPTLSTFNAEPSFDIEGMWEFLDQGKRREWLYKLLCAVVHSTKTYRRIVILDSTENVAWWIAIISSLLPPDYRPLLSFATYHHDPNQSPFMITGTTSDLFQPSFEQYQSYFVLNTWEDLCSDVKESLYAQVVTEAAQLDSYYDRLLPLLAFARRFPKPIIIDEQLDMIMLYAKLLTGRATTILSEEELAVIHLAVQSIEQLPSLSEQVDELNPLEELEHLQGILADARGRQQLPTIIAEYTKVDRLLKKHKADQELQTINQTLSTLERLPDFTPEQLKELERIQSALAESLNTQRSPIFSAQFERVNTLLKQYWTRNTERVQRDLKGFVEYLVQLPEQEVNVVSLNQLQQTYGTALLREQVNQVAFLSGLVEMLLQRKSHQVWLVWHQLGTYIMPGPQSQYLLILSLNVVQRLWNEQRGEEVHNLLAAMRAAIKGDELAWLELAMSSNSQVSPGILPVFYYEIVRSLALEQRLPFRQTILRLYALNEILEYEILHDVSNTGLQQSLPIIEQWINHAHLQRYEISLLLTSILEQLRKQYPLQQWRELVTGLLISNYLAPLNPDIEALLVGFVMPIFSLTMKPISPVDIELCRRYLNNQNLSEDTRTTLATLLAMTNGTMDQTLAQHIQAQVKILLPHEYEPGVQCFMQAFLQRSITMEAHKCAILAFFTRSFGYDVHFWSAYIGAWHQIFLNPETTTKWIEMLDFWFTTKPIEFPQPYIVQEFFLRLPLVLMDLRKSIGFSSVVPIFTSVAAHKPWYPIVQAYFPEQAKAFGALGGVFNQFIGTPLAQKFNPNPGKALEERKQRLATSVQPIFDGKRTLTNHELLSKLLSREYDPQFREQFWEYYWQQFRNLLMKGEVDVILDVLSFWFDTAYKTQEKSYYLPQNFFLGLFASRSAVYELPAFHNTAKRIEEKIAAQKKDAYPWYPLIRNYFTFPELPSAAGR